MGRSDDNFSQSLRTIVYVDPDEDRSAQVKKRLESIAEAEFTVETVATKAALCQRLITTDIDCVVSEYQLTETDGIELCTQLRDDYPTLPVILYTDGNESLASDAVAAGISGYVPRTADDSIAVLADRIKTTVADTDTTSAAYWERIEAMHDVALRFESCSDAEAAYRLAVEAVDTLLDGEASVLYAERESPAMTRVSDDLVSVAAVGTSETAFFQQSVSRSIAEQAHRTDDPYTVNPQSFDADVSIRSVVCVPVGSIGVLQTVSTHPATFDDHDVKLVELLAAHLSATISRIRSERALRNERDRFASLFESVPDPVAFTNPTGTSSVIDINPAFEDTFGYERAELIGQSLAEYIIPADSDRIDVHEEVGLDDVISREVTRLTADGPRDFLFRGFAIETDDEIHEYAIYTDITERKRREQRIRTLHDGSRKLMGAESVTEVAQTAVDIATDVLDIPLIGVHIYDPEVDGLCPVAVSTATEELIGNPPVIHSNDGLAWVAFDRQEPMVYDDIHGEDGLTNPNTAVKSEAYLPLGDHGIFIAGSTAPADVTDEEFNLAKILAANVEAALDRAERESELERQNDRLEAFASTVSHDLRNPLSLASGHTALARDCHPDELPTHLDEIEWALTRMNDLIEDVLLLARSGQRVTETEPVSLETIISKASRSVGSELTVTIDGSLPVVDGDANRILVLFENLFRNSVEHGSTDHANAPTATDSIVNSTELANERTDDTDTGSVTVTVGTIDGGLFVADNGPGIPDKHRDSVFESGYTTDPDGTGFGLAIVSEIVDAHGWTIDAVENDSGARFEIRFD